MKPFSALREVILKHLHATKTESCNDGGDYAFIHPQRNLSRVPEQRRARHGETRSEAVMAEVVAVLLVFVSASIFFARAYGAHRTKATGRNVL
jgi:hypothetical protein